MNERVRFVMEVLAFIAIVSLFLKRSPELSTSYWINTYYPNQAHQIHVLLATACQVVLVYSITRLSGDHGTSVGWDFAALIAATGTISLALGGSKRIREAKVTPQA